MLQHSLSFILIEKLFSSFIIGKKENFVNSCSVRGVCIRKKQIVRDHIFISNYWNWREGQGALPTKREECICIKT